MARVAPCKVANRRLGYPWVRKSLAHPLIKPSFQRWNRGLWCNSGFDPKVDNSLYICNDRELRSQRSSPNLWHRGFAATEFANLELPFPDLLRQLNSADRHAGRSSSSPPSLESDALPVGGLVRFRYSNTCSSARARAWAVRHFSSTPPPRDLLD